jgi:hypothetical protein
MAGLVARHLEILRGTIRTRAISGNGALRDADVARVVAHHGDIEGGTEVEAFFIGSAAVGVGHTMAAAVTAHRQVLRRAWWQGAIRAARAFRYADILGTADSVRAAVDVAGALLYG